MVRQPIDTGNEVSRCLCRLSACLFLVGMLALASPWVRPQLAAAAQSETGRRWAILIGVNEYSNAQGLKYSVADQQALRDQLIAAGYSKQRLFLLRDGAPEARYLPFKSNIEQQLQLVLGLVDENDTVLVAFSGHGVQFGEKAYLCPTDTNLDDPATMVSLDWVYGQLKRCPAAFKLLTIDACRNDPRVEGRRALTDETNGFARSLGKPPPEGIVLLSSCSPGEISMEDKQFGHGVFMHFLLDGFGGKADTDKDSKISLHELSRYAGQETKLYVARRFNMSQRPYLKGDVTIEALDFPIAELMRPSLLTNSIGMKLKLIPAGEFQMGSGKSAEEIARLFDSKAEYHKDEHPQHRVRITKPFYMGVHEVTVGQFHEFVRAEGYKTESERDGEGGYGWNKAEGKFEGRDPKYNWRNTGFSQDDSHPVVNVTWNDAVAFCKWLSGKEGKQYRLPTEAEWEYACRAGTTTMYYCGDDPEGLARVGNVADGTARRQFSEWTTISADDGHVFTAPVGQFRANDFGLYDMHGNVYEWCQDWYGEQYYAISPSADPKGASSGSSRVLRGGSWNYVAGYCRSANRDRLTAGNRSIDDGFRLLCEFE